MNNEKKVELLMNIVQKEFRAVFDKTYDAAYHNGCNDERLRLSLEGWLVLNPNKIREFEEVCQDPCKHCKIYERVYKKGCGCGTDPAECDKKQRQLRALEIRKYFMS